MVVDETLYSTLGVKVSSSSTTSHFKKAYHKLAKEYHPDRNTENGEKFKEISFAYKVLANPTLRRDYDMYGLDGNKVAKTLPEYAIKGFRRIKYLGSGFFGTVSLFRAPADAAYAEKHHKVVIKEVVNSQRNTMAAMNEGELLKGADHWGIVEFLAHFTNERDNMCIVMEYCDRGTLTEFVTSMSHLEFNIWRFLGNLSCALEYLHKKGIQHRDLKPDNILGKSIRPATNKEGPPGITCKIADFGVANLLNTRAQQLYYAQSCAASEVYMAPEVVLMSVSVSNSYGSIELEQETRTGSSQLQYTPAADIWSLGALVSFWANRRHLFTSPDQVRRWGANRSDLSVQRYSDELRHLHAVMLHPNSAARPTASHLVNECFDRTRMQAPVVATSHETLV